MRTLATVVLAAAVAAACNSSPAVNDVPVGSDVQVTRQDGALVEGTLTERTPQAVTVDVGPTTESVPRDEIADLRVKDSAHPDEVPKAAKFREVAVPAETKLAIELDSHVGSGISTVGDAVRGYLAEPVVVGGLTAVPMGASVTGTVTNAVAAGKVKGRAEFALQFATLRVNGDSYPIDARFARTAEPTKTEDAKKVGIPAAGGALIGAIIGGKKGAAIGAAAGAGAGASVVLTTPGRDIDLEEGATLSLQTGKTLRVRVPIQGRGRDSVDPEGP